MNLQTQLQSPYSRDTWTGLQQEIFGSSAELFRKPAPITEKNFHGVFSHVLHLGDLKTADGQSAALLDIEVVPDLNLSRNRASIRHLAARFIDGTRHPALLAAFHSNESTDWRVSFIAREKTLDLATGQTRTIETPARRFTYLLGPDETCRTAAERFEGLRSAGPGQVSLKTIEDAFRVEKLTKEFYGELSDWYFWALTRVRFPDDMEKNEETRNATMTIRLVTRLMFVWFLKQKKLIPDALFDRTAIGSLLNFKDKTCSTYYKAILQNLFFSTLNLSAQGDVRRFIRRQPGCAYYRYARFFKNEAACDQFIDLCKNIPFLNGGLFENLDRDVDTDTPIRIDGFSNRSDQETRLAVPDDLFFSKEQIVNLSVFYDDKKKSAVKVKGLFEILNAYNFTVEENTPYDQKVALDPELLGQVFENLLASYNPETKNTARKQTGSFYTPREIVHYMVDESIVAHLKQTVGAGLEGEYRKLIGYADESLDLTDAQKSAIVRALFTCKIIDPACGSGAFPMGVLQQMVHILNQLDPNNTLWRQLVLNQALQETGEALKSTDGGKEERLAEIGRVFDESLNRPDYARKLYLIENCIYGVDIQPIAVQISKLRFFISLVVEQTSTQDRENNFGIRPLPNLETRFVAANTLIGIDMPNDWMNDTTITRLGIELKAIRHKHFSARTTETKRKYRALDKAKREELKNHLVTVATKPDEEKIRRYQEQVKMLGAERVRHLDEKWVDEMREPQPTDLFCDNKPTQRGLFRIDINKQKRDEIDKRIQDYTRMIDAERAKARSIGFEAEAQKLALWDPYDQNAVSPFFDSEWMFGVSDGFDIVIGNPPYIQLQNNGGERADLYNDCGFETYERTGDIYALFYERAYQLLKTEAHLCYITSNKWMRSGYGESLRKFLSEKTQPLTLIDFAGQKIFEAATVDTNILLARRVNILKTSPNKHDPCCAVIANENCRKEMSVFVRQNATTCQFNTSESWVILTPIEQRIKTKIEKVGVPLKDWNISINYGIKTGFNDAFIVNEEKRNEILANCQTADERKRTDELIRPILRGRDIKRYSYNWAGLYLIATHNGIPEKGVTKIDIKKYPTVKRHLDSYWAQIEKRTDQGDTPYNLRSCAYWEDFSKPKIVWGNLSLSAGFSAAQAGMFVNAPCPMIVPFNGYLLAVLNSRLGDWYIRQNGVTRNGGYFEYKPMFVERLPVPQIGQARQSEFAKLALRHSPEDQLRLDKMVYALYELTDSEVAFMDDQKRHF